MRKRDQLQNSTNGSNSYYSCLPDLTQLHAVVFPDWGLISQMGHSDTISLCEQLASTHPSFLNPASSSFFHPCGFVAPLLHHKLHKLFLFRTPFHKQFSGSAQEQMLQALVILFHNKQKQRLVVFGFFVGEGGHFHLFVSNFQYQGFCTRGINIFI